MLIVDIIILILLLFGFVLGFKRGFTRQLISFLGLFIILILAFYLKNPVSQFMYENFPFFAFDGLFKGVTVLNIVLYETLAFFIVLSILGIILKVLIFASKIFETLLNMTIILGIPSKILGGLVGVLEAYVMIFIILFILASPMTNIPFVEESKFKSTILNSTPILSSYIDDSMSVFNEFDALKVEYENGSNKDEFNYKSLDLFLKYDIITVQSVEKLVEKGKIQIINIDDLISKYKESEE